MQAQTIDLSAGLVPKQPGASSIDLSAGIVPNNQASGAIDLSAGLVPKPQLTSSNFPASIEPRLGLLSWNCLQGVVLVGHGDMVGPSSDTHLPALSYRRIVHLD